MHAQCRMFTTLPPDSSRRLATPETTLQSTPPPSTGTADEYDTGVATYVGKGGSWIQEASFRYVGEGAGDIAMRPPRQCVPGFEYCLAGSGLTALFMPLLIWGIAFSRAGAPGAAGAARVVAPGAEHGTLAMDCMGGYSHWERDWSAERKAYCCREHRRGCPTESQRAPRLAAVETYEDCVKGLRTSGQRWWSTHKQAWCCHRQQVGCPKNPSSTFNCSSGYDNWVSKWSLGKRFYCCLRTHRGCPTPPPRATAQPARALARRQPPAAEGASPVAARETGSRVLFDCYLGFSEWKKTWSESKRDWCCRHGGRGCSTVKTSKP